MRILLVCPDQTLRSVLNLVLSRHRFIIDVAVDDEEAWELIQAFIYDVVLLEVRLPNLDGVTLCQRLRNVGNPVLVLLLLESADLSIGVQGLESGADAYLVKPIQEPELLAHLRALARRLPRCASLLLTWGPLSLNSVAQQITCDGQVLKINRKEYQILELFLRYPRKMFSRSEIGDRLWTLDEQLPNDATIKSHIRSIRRKLEQVGAKDFIQTHYGQGYCLDPAYDGGTQSSDDPNSPRTGTAPLVDYITANLWQELMAANARLTQEIQHSRAVEAQLRRSEIMLRNAQRVAQVGCWEFDYKTRKTYWTEELFLIHGLDPKRPAPNPEEVLNLIHPDDRQLHEAAIRIPALKREPFEVNLRIVRVSDGEIRHINARGGPIVDNSGQIIKLTGTTLDITEWLSSSPALYGTLTQLVD